MSASPTIAVIALQGAVDAHLRAFSDIGVRAVPVRQVRHLAALESVDGVVLPGGESTTLSLLLRLTGLDAEVARLLDAGTPMLGTCAGMILLAREVLDGRADQMSFAAIDLSVRRNGFGRQLESFEAPLAVDGLDSEFPGVFIRAPKVVGVGEGVEVLSSVERFVDEPSSDGRSDALSTRGSREDVRSSVAMSSGRTPVLCRQGHVWAAAFHPELTADRRIHQMFADAVSAAASGAVRRALASPVTVDR